MKLNCCLIIVLMLSFFSGLTMAEEKAKSAAPKPEYFRFYPDFVTNLKALANKPSYIQIRVEVMIANVADKKIMEVHEPLLRDRLIMLFNSKTKTDLSQYSGKKSHAKRSIKNDASHFKRRNWRTRGAKDFVY